MLNCFQDKIRSHQTALFLVVAITLITFIVFLPALNNGFTNWDDGNALTENPMVKKLSPQALHNIFTDRTQGLYIPLVIFSYTLEHHFFGLDPFIYHLNNLLLHVLNTLLVFVMIYLLSKKNLSVAFMTSLLFGIHPLRVESVAWVTERKDVLYAFFYLWAILSYMVYLAKNNPKKYYLLSIFFFILSTLSKPAAVTLPVILFLYDYIMERPKSIHLLIDKLPFFGVAIIIGFINIFVRLELVPTRPHPPTSLDVFLLSMDSIIFYLSKQLLPLNLSALYQFSSKPGCFLFPLLASSPIVVLALTAGIIYSSKYTRKIVFGFSFFIIHVLPVLALIPWWGIEAALGDRYMYLPSVGITYALVYFGYLLYEKTFRKYRWAPKVFLSAVFIVIMVFAQQSWARCKIWGNGFTLWTDTIQKSPGSSKAWVNLGTYYMSIKKPLEAIPNFKRALTVDPLLSMAHNNLGAAYKEMGDYDRAIDSYNKAIAYDPKYLQPYNNRGIAYFEKGKMLEAMMNFNLAVQRAPNDEKAYFNRGAVYQKIGRLDEALVEYNRAIALNPSYAKAYDGRGMVYFKRGQVNRAIVDYSRAIALDRLLGMTYYHRALAYLLEKNLTASLQDAYQAKKLGHEVSSHFMKNLKEAFESNGQRLSTN